MLDYRSYISVVSFLCFLLRLAILTFVYNSGFLVLESSYIFTWVSSLFFLSKFSLSLFGWLASYTRDLHNLYPRESAFYATLSIMSNTTLDPVLPVYKALVYLSLYSASCLSSSVFNLWTIVCLISSLWVILYCLNSSFFLATCSLC